MPMVMYTMVNGQMTKHMDLESIVILMGPNMKDIGKKINNMVKDQKHGQMAPNMKDNMYKERNTEREDSHGLMEVLIMDCLQKIISKDKESIIGLMAENMTDYG